MGLDTMIEKLTWKTKVAFALSVVFGIWIMREPLIGTIFCEDSKIINQLKANVEQQKIKTGHNELETDFNKRLRSFRRIGTII